MRFVFYISRSSQKLESVQPSARGRGLSRKRPRQTRRRPSTKSPSRRGPEHRSIAKSPRLYRQSILASNEAAVEQQGEGWREAQGRNGRANLCPPKVTTEVLIMHLTDLHGSRIAHMQHATLPVILNTAGMPSTSLSVPRMPSGPEKPPRALRANTLGPMETCRALSAGKA